MEDPYCGYCVHTATYSGYAGHVTGYLLHWDQIDFH